MSEFFPYVDAELRAENVPVRRIAETVGTPVYIYSAGAFATLYRRLAAAFSTLGARTMPAPMICYAVKANSNLAVLRLFGRLGAGADVVSEGEMRRALAAGISPSRMVFSGIGKTRAELAAALAAGIHQINVESIEELDCLSAVAVAEGRRAPVAIRVNPDVDAETHAKIATGKKENKFGIDLADAADAYHRAAVLPGIEPVGLAMHIGSQLLSLRPYRDAFSRLAELVRTLRARGLAVRRLDLGGGLGIRYRDETPLEPEAYAALIRDTVGDLDVALAIEPGRALSGPAGLLVTQIVHVKQGHAKRFVIVDAAMNDLIRPALYESWHDLLPVRAPAVGAPWAPADIVGPVCETGDTFAVDRNLPPLADGDLVAFASAGAYGAVMSSTYNSRLLVPEVLVSGERFDVIRERPSYDSMLALDHVPAWLAEAADPGDASDRADREMQHDRFRLAAG